MAACIIEGALSLALAAYCIAFTIQSANSKVVSRTFGETVFYSKVGRLVFIMIPVAVGSPGLTLLLNVLNGIAFRGDLYSKLGLEYYRRDVDPNEVMDMLMISTVSWCAWVNAFLAIALVDAFLPGDTFWSDVSLHATAAIGFVLPVALVVLGVLFVKVARSFCVGCGCCCHRRSLLPFSLSLSSTRKRVFFGLGQTLFVLAWFLARFIHVPAALRWALLATHVARLMKVARPYVAGALECFVDYDHDYNYDYARDHECACGESLPVASGTEEGDAVVALTLQDDDAEQVVSRSVNLSGAAMK